MSRNWANLSRVILWVCWLFWVPSPVQGQALEDPPEEEPVALACGLVRYSVNRPAFEGNARPLLVVSGTVAGRVSPGWLEACPDDLSIWDRVKEFSFMNPGRAMARFGEEGEDGAFLVDLRDPMP